MIEQQLVLHLSRRLLGQATMAVAWHDGHAGTHLLRAKTEDHGGVIVKVHRAQERHVQEVHAYRTWTPALGERAPRLLATNGDPPAIVVTTVPGIPLAQRQLDRAGEQDAYQQAGHLLRKLHGAGAPRWEPDWAAWLADRAEYWIHQAGDRISRTYRNDVRAHMRALRDLAPLPTVPCHLDFMPRNLMHADDGTLRLIDFEHSRYDLAARDLVRLATRIWIDRPDLQKSFVSGYGDLTATDIEVIDHCGTLDALTTLACGRSSTG
ncbi:phosphotransferase enzyme family protein [Micromonospora sp. NPDC004704]